MRIETSRDRSAAAAQRTGAIEDARERARNQRIAAQARTDYLFEQINRSKTSACRRAPVQAAPEHQPGRKDPELEQAAARAMLWLSVIGVMVLTGIAVAVCVLV